MNRSEFIEKVKSKYNINIEFESKIETFKNFLQEQNKLFNLTRLDNDADIYDKYFYQSIEPFFIYELKNKSILDIGSGSGIPGLALKILEPTLKLTIIESNNKRIDFMKSLCKLLLIEDVTFIYARAEDNWKPWKEKFDIVTSRAVSNIGTLLEISCQYAKINGLIIEPKSHNYKQEYEKVSNKLTDYGLILNNIDTYDNTTCLVFKKINSVSDKYPRQWKDIVKEFK